MLRFCDSLDFGIALCYSPDIKINLSKAFEEWEFNIGFNSEIYACEEEFNDAEAYYDL